MPRGAAYGITGRTSLWPRNCVCTLHTSREPNGKNRHGRSLRWRETEEIKTKRASFSPHPRGEAWAELGAQAAVPNQYQAPVSTGPASRAATKETRQHLHLWPPGTARDGVPEHAPAGPAPLSPPPLSAHSPLGPGSACPPSPTSARSTTPHTQATAQPRVRGRRAGGPWAEDCARSHSSPLDGEGVRSPLRSRTHPGRPPSWC